jgi:hypothetical protein
MFDVLLVPASEAAGMLGIGKTLFYEMHSTGRLGPLPVKFNSKQMWSVIGLRDWVEAGCPPRHEWIKTKGFNQ